MKPDAGALMDLAIYCRDCRKRRDRARQRLAVALSTDLKRFKATTMGKPIIMGRKTWQSIGRPLPGRLNIVITRDAGFRRKARRSLARLTKRSSWRPRARCMAARTRSCVIGGGEIYGQALPLADRLYVTHVLAISTAIPFFRRSTRTSGSRSAREEFPAGDKDNHATRYTVYERREGRDIEGRYA